MDALTPKTIDLTPLIPVLRALSLCIMGTFLKHSILLIKVYRNVETVISDYVEELGFSVVRSFIGHGVGRQFHWKPDVLHYRGNKANGFMKPGHIFTIEPMINAGTYKDVRWLDDWTAVTADGQRSAQFEHTILITEDGWEVLTARTDTSPILEIHAV